MKTVKSVSHSQLMSLLLCLQINKDPDVRLDPFFVVGEEIPKKVWFSYYLYCSVAL